MVKGYLAVFSRTAENNPGIEAILQNWIRSKSGVKSKIFSGPGFEMFFFGQDSSTMQKDQVFKHDLDANLIHFWAGPMTEVLSRSKGLQFPTEPDSSLPWQEKLFSQGNDLNIYLRYRLSDRSITIKTDLLNSTYVYKTILADGTTLFSSSSHLLANLSEAGLDELSMIEFTGTGSIYGNRSLYKNVSMMLPSRFHFQSENGTVSSQEYWHLEKLKIDSIGLHEAVESITAKLDSQFSLLDLSQKKWVIDLTGGYDSRMNLAFALRKLKNFETIVYGDKTDPDVVISCGLSKKFDFVHRVNSPFEFENQDLLTSLAEAAGPTDFEINLFEYSRIYRVHTEKYHKDENSIHGSTADVSRTVFLQPGVFNGTPYGQMNFEGMIDLKYPSILNTRSDLNPRLRMDWHGHMRKHLESYDVVGFPAHTRTDIVYLRTRMQFWQGRIGSATNQIHTSMTPWTDLGILNTLLSTKYTDKKKGMISRTLLKTAVKGLDQFPIANGKPAGTGFASELKVIPERMRYMAGRAAKKLNLASGKLMGQAEYFFSQNYLCKNADIFEGFLDENLIRRLEKKELPLSSKHHLLLSRLFTLAQAKNSLRNSG